MPSSKALQSSTIGARLILVVFWAIFSLGGPTLLPVYVDNALAVLDRRYNGKRFLMFVLFARLRTRRYNLYAAGFLLLNLVLEAAVTFRVGIVRFWALDVADCAFLFVGGNLHTEG